MVREVAVAYCAGVIDSDGTIGIVRREPKKAGGWRTFLERVCVKQVEPEAIALLKDTFGGHVGISKASLANGRDLFLWQVTGVVASSVLTELLPYLRIKHQQALNCLDLRSVKNQSNAWRKENRKKDVPDGLRMKMSDLFLRAKSLNAVGKRPAVVS